MLNIYCQCGCERITPISPRNRVDLGHIKGQHIPYLLGHRVKSRNLKGEKHWNFKGDQAGYKALHLRVNQIRGKATLCNICASQSWVEWANLTERYEDPTDYEALCRKCHNKFDRINQKRTITLGKNQLIEIAKKGWETRRKTSFEASSVLRPAEGGVLRE